MSASTYNKPVFAGLKTGAVVTLAGYGITDAYTITQADAAIAAGRGLVEQVKVILMAVGDLAFVQIPYAATIRSATIAGYTTTGATVSGSAVVDVWKDTHANYPPTAADTITASAKPTVSGSAAPVVDSTLTGWGVNIAAGDWLVFKLDSVTTFGKVECALKLERA